MTESIWLAICVLAIFSPAIVMLLQAKDAASKLIAVIICALSVVGLAEFKELDINNHYTLNNYGERIK